MSALENSEEEKQSELHVEEELEPVGEEVQVDKMTSMAEVLETDQFAHVLARIFSFLDTPDVKRVSLVSR